MKTTIKIISTIIGFIIGGVLAHKFLDTETSKVVFGTLALTIGYLWGFIHSKV